MDFGFTHDGRPFSGRAPRWQTLIDLINSREYRALAEIGVFYGATALKVLDGCSLDVYFLVDVHPATAVHAQIFGTRAVYMAMSSLEASKYIAPASLDLVFVDALHDYPYCLEDITAWLPKVRKGGVICGHDYCRFSPGVVRAVNETFDEFDVVDDNAPDILSDSVVTQSGVWIAYL